jgi:ferredoxin
MSDVEEYKIVHEKKICIGCFACTNVAPEYWDMEENGNDPKSHLVDSEKVEDREERELKEDYDKNLEAAEVCPVNCIHIEKDGKREI